MELQLPNSSRLSGADYFLLALDHNMRKQSSQGNVCRLSILLSGHLSAQTLRSYLEDKTLVKWINSAELKNGWFQLPSWRLAKPGELTIFEHISHDGSEEIPQEILARDLSLGQGRNLNFDLIHHGQEKTLFILSWHHSLMDAHGGELLVKYLAGLIPEERIRDIFPKPSKTDETVLARLNQAKAAKNLIVEKSKAPVASLVRDKSTKYPQLKYQVVEFSLEETALVEKTCQRYGANFRKSLLYLAASTRALDAVLSARGNDPLPYCVSFPLDLRKKGAYGPIVSNHLTMMFFRIPSEKLGELGETFTCLNEQLLTQSRSGAQKSYSSMMSLFLRLPLPVYSTVLASPANLHSFYFSDTGDALNGFASFLGQSVENFTHYPPNSYPPGFTVIFSRFNKCLAANIGYADSAIDPEELALFTKTLKQELTQGDLS